MSDSDTGGAHADKHRTETVEAGDGTAVQIEEYPGGDMTVYKSGGEDLYFNSAQAGALRTAFGRLDAQKGGDSSE
jgi:hypothetical protein